MHKDATSCSFWRPLGQLVSSWYYNDADFQKGLCPPIPDFRQAAAPVAPWFLRRCTGNTRDTKKHKEHKGHREHNEHREHNKHYGGPEVHSRFPFAVHRSPSFVPLVFCSPSFEIYISRLSFVVRRFSFVVRQSSFVVHRSSFVVHRSSVIVRHSSFIVHRSSFVVHRSSFIVHHSSFVVRRSSFVIRPSSFVVSLSSFVNRRSSFFVSLSSFVNRRSSFVIRHFSSFIVCCLSFCRSSFQFSFVVRQSFVVIHSRSHALNAAHAYFMTVCMWTGHGTFSSRTE